MHEEAKNLILQRIKILVREIISCRPITEEQLIEGFNFSQRQKTHPEECICYREAKPCHDLNGKLNCTFCYCPGYDLKREQGGCKFGNPEGKGKEIDFPNNGIRRIWDCSNCTFPHQKQNTINFLQKVGIQNKTFEELEESFKELFGVA